MEDYGSVADRAVLLDGLAETCVRAGAAILAIYATDFAVHHKNDSSPVTEADAAAEAIILAALQRLAADIPVVAEEEASAGRIPTTDGCFFLVDPLDGTKEFVERRGDFTVNVALIEAHAPSLGIVYAPVDRRLYAGDVLAGVAWTALVAEDGTIGPREPLAIRQCPAAGIDVVASRSHNSPQTETYLDQFEIASRVSRGSSLKICMVAAGAADLYPRLAPTFEWDIAAGDAVLRAAGGILHAPDGAPMRYGKANFFNPGFVAAGDLVPPPIDRLPGAPA